VVWHTQNVFAWRSGKHLEAHHSAQSYAFNMHQNAHGIGNHSPVENACPLNNWSASILGKVDM
jgi:hypothetical protein